MRHDNVLYNAILLAILTVSVCRGQQFPQVDLDRVSPDLENKLVRVIHVRIPPNDGISFKASSVESIAVSLHEYALKVSPDKGSPEQWSASAGSVMRMRGGMGYSLANQSDRPAELLIAELLGSNRFDQLVAPHTTFDPVELDPRHFRTVLQNEQLRVVHVSVEPHGETEDAQFSTGVLINLQDTHTIRTRRDGNVQEYQRAAGTVSWEKDGFYSIKNAEEKPVDSVLLEFRRPFCYEVTDSDVPPDAQGWYDKMYWTMLQTWQYEMFWHQPNNAKGIIVVSVKIQPGGKLRDEDVSVISAFASDSMVEAALSAVRKIKPFSPPPAIQKVGEVRFHFLANLPQRPPGCN